MKAVEAVIFFSASASPYIDFAFAASASIDFVFAASASASIKKCHFRCFRFPSAPILEEFFPYVAELAGPFQISYFMMMARDTAEKEIRL